MQTPQFARYEFLDDAAFNAASSAVSGDFATLALAGIAPGLVRPDVATVAATGLSIGVTLPAPFGVLFNTGVLAGAHGTATGLDTQNYTVSVASLVPASGSTTVFIAATSVAIQQQPYTVVGPPPGHPNYTPNFAPFTAYAQIVDSMNIIASTSKPNNTTSFEICRMTLSAGATGISGLTLIHQVLASSYPYLNVISVNGNKTLGLADVGVMQEVNASAAFVTLPAAALFSGKPFTVAAVQSAAFTLQVPDAALIFGVGIVPSSGVSSYSLISGTSITVVSDGTNWIAIGGAGYAPIFNPTFTGTPRAPTATAGTGGTQIATNAYADTSAAAALAAAEAFASANFLPLTGGTLTGGLHVSGAGLAVDGGVTFGAGLSVSGAVGLGAGLTVGNGLTVGTTITASGTITTNGNLNVIRDGENIAAQITLSGDSGQNKSLNFETGSLLRFNWFVNTEPDVGAAGGSNMLLAAYLNTGAFLGNIVKIFRNTQIWQFFQSPIVPNLSASDNSANVPNTIYVDRQALVNNIAPMTVTSSPGVTIGANFNQTKSITFTAPCKGTVSATSFLNVSDASSNAIASANITATLTINSTGVGGDTTPTPQSHQGTAAVTAGTVVTVSLNVVTTTMPTNAKGTFSCGASFTPTL